MRGFGYTGPMRGNRSNITNRRGGALANFANRGSAPVRATNIRGGAMPNFRTVTNVRGGAVPKFNQSQGISAFAPSGPTARQAQDQSMQLLQQRRNQTRRDFFDNRQDVSDNRLDRRQIQQDLMDQFRNTQMKDVVGASGLKQSIVPGGPTMADRSMELARMYGPTLGEIGSDIKFGFSQIGKGLAEKGTPLMSLLKDIYGGITNFFTPTGGQGPVPTDQFASFKQGMNNAQLGLFNYYINKGNSPEYARNAALSGVVPQMAMGGVTSL